MFLACVFGFKVTYSKTAVIFPRFRSILAHVHNSKSVPSSLCMNEPSGFPADRFYVYEKLNRMLMECCVFTDAPGNYQVLPAGCFIFLRVRSFSNLSSLTSNCLIFHVIQESFKDLIQRAQAMY